MSAAIISRICPAVSQPAPTLFAKSSVTSGSSRTASAFSVTSKCTVLPRQASFCAVSSNARSNEIVSSAFFPCSFSCSSGSGLSSPSVISP
jgi:hypothetical protein